MKHTKKFFNLFILLSIVLCSCTKTSQNFENLKGKFFFTKENVLFIAGKKDVEKNKNLKENDLLLIEFNHPENYKIFKNTKITKKDKKDFLSADNLTLNLQVIDEKTIKDIDKDIEYKKIDDNDLKDKKILSKIDTSKKVDLTDDLIKIQNKAFTSDLGVSVIFSVYENKEAVFFIKENDKEKAYKNAKLVKENEKTYIKADGLNQKFIYKNINTIIDEDTNIEYKLNNKK